MKEISKMKLNDCKDYAINFDSKFGKGITTPNKRNSRRKK